MTKPLEGVRILDLTMFLAGPFAGRIVADLGADVLKVEPLVTGDPSRRGLGLVPGSPPSSQFIAIHRNKKSVTIDLKSEAGKEVFYDLVRRSDMLLENYRPGVTKRLGIDYGTLNAIHPPLIYCSMTGFGSEGPLAQKAAFDAIIQAMSGAMSMTGPEDGPPALMGIFMGDLAAPCFGIHAALAALYAREKTGVGCHIDLALLEGLLYLAPSQTQSYLLSGQIATRHGSGYGHDANAQSFETADGKYLQIMCPYPKFQESLRAVIGAMPQFAQEVQDARFDTPETRAQHISAYWDLVGRAIRTKPLQEWLDILESADIPCAPVNNIGEALENPQVSYRQTIREVEVSGLGRVRTFGNPFKFSNVAESEVLNSPPILGQDTEAVLRDVLGYTPEHIASLRDAGAI